jgi:hypothetical protein
VIAANFGYSVLCIFGFITPKTLNYVAFQSSDLSVHDDG